MKLALFEAFFVNVNVMDDDDQNSADGTLPANCFMETNKM